MIAYIKGTLSEVYSDSIVVEHQEMGYQIFVPASVLEQMPAVGAAVKVYTYLYVREDILCLYGFLTRDDMNIFKLLITVSGIGPKGGLAILSAMSTDQLRFAVLAGDTKTISKAPGVGTKTAQRLIIELKDKLKIEDVLVSPGSMEAEDIAAGSHAAPSAKNDAILALTALGYSNTKALAAVSKVKIEEDMDSEAILKAALKFILTM